MDLKRKYNKWLFKKYGFERGPLFENIPAIFTSLPLFSPSLYGMCEGNRLVEYIEEGRELNGTARFSENDIK